MSLNKVKINTRIRISFVLLVLIAAGLSAVGVFQYVKLNDNYKEKIVQINSKITETSDAAVRFQNIKFYASELILYAGNPQKFDSASKGIVANQQEVGAIAGRYASLLTGEYEIAAFNANGENIEKYFEVIGGLENNLREKQLTVGEASVILEEQALPLAQSIVDAMILANQTATGELAEVVKNNTDEVNSTVLLIAIMTLVILGISIFASFVVSNSINIPIKNLIEVARKISKGNLDIDIRINGTDEISVLSNEFAMVADTLNKLTDDVYKMSEDIHVRGDVESRINESDFSGGYLKIVSGFNMVIDGLTGDTIELIKCLNQYAQGDFNAQIKRYVGKKAILNDAVDVLQSNLKSIVTDINDLAVSASNGDLTKKIDEKKYKHDWAKITAGLNTVLVNIVNPIRETISVLEEMSQGNLSMSINGQYRGEYLTMKTAVNDMQKKLSMYIKEISDILNRMANGEFDFDVKSDFIGDFAPIKQSFINILYEFNTLLGNINFTAKGVGDKSADILNSVHMLSESTDDQVNAVNKLISSVSTITDQTHQNSISSSNANTLAYEAKVKASAGSEEMKVMLDAMNDINDASNNISKIIKVIEDIAFQTNLLALNAAVEAARAGSHGKGFAVVAEEVRNLARRSQTAVADTTTLITGSVDKVSVGMNIANQTSETLLKVVDQITNISDMINNIAAASKKQEEATKELNAGINIISDVTNNNASFVSSEAESAKDLADKSEELQLMISAFKIK